MAHEWLLKQAIKLICKITYKTIYYQMRHSFIQKLLFIRITLRSFNISLIVPVELVIMRLYTGMRNMLVQFGIQKYAKGNI